MVFRNDPCPCGSGKRHKKCCLKKAKAAEKRLENAEKAAKEAMRTLEATAKKLAAAGFFIEDDDLDEVSNSVIDLVEEKKFDEALRACARLLDEWPDVIDGLERTGLVYQKMGDWEKARDFYTRALAFIDRPDQRGGFPESERDYYRDLLSEIEKAATADR